MPKHKITAMPLKEKSIRFNMDDDDRIRNDARRCYEVSKVFKESGLTFRFVLPAHSDPSIKRLFRLGPKGPNLCLEVSLANMNENQILEYIEEIKDQFLLLPQFVLVDDKPYKLGRGLIVQRFLFRPSKVQV